MGEEEESGVERRLHIAVPSEKLVEFCQRRHIRRLAFFGSVLRDDFRPDSDVDILVEFESGHLPGLLGLAGLEIELSALLGRKVDLNTPGFFGVPLRDQVMAEALVQYG